MIGGFGEVGFGDAGFDDAGGFILVAPPADVALSAATPTVVVVTHVTVATQAATISLTALTPALNMGVLTTGGHVARASYRLQVAWDAYNIGLLTFGSSSFDGADVFGVSPLDVTFSGVYDDVSRYVDNAAWSRGRDDNLSTMLAGQATFEIRDPGWTDGTGWHPGLFNPNNPTSPLAGRLEDRLHPIKWEGTLAGVTHGLFTGWVRRIVWSPRGTRGRGIVRLECGDLFYWLQRVQPVIVGTGPTTIGAAIGLVLDAAGLTDAAMRDLDDGDAIDDFFADGSLDGLQIIEALLTAERGSFFATGFGVATYRSRVGRLLKTSVWTVADRMIDTRPALDFDQAKTRVRVTWVDGLGVPIWFSEATSSEDRLNKLGLSDLPEIVTTYLTNTDQADSLAAWILAQVESPRSPMYGLKIDNREGDLLAQILTRELVDRITALESAGGTAGQYHIDRMDHVYDRTPDGRHTVSWLLSQGPQVTAAMFDSATFDSDAAFVL